MKNSYILFILSFCITLCYSQNFNYVLGKQFGNAANDEFSNVKMKRDNLGNIIVYGQFRGTVDMDPSANVSNIVGFTNTNIWGAFIAKYDANCNYLWSFPLVSPYFIDIHLTLDNSNNIYIGGGYQGVVDFDPSSNIATLPNGGNSPSGIQYNYFARYDVNGNYQFSQNISSTGWIEYKDIAYDNFYNQILLCGSWQGTVDFDSGLGIDNHSTNSIKSFLVRYTTFGSLVWSNTSLGFPFAGNVRVDNNGNTFVLSTNSSGSSGTIDKFNSLGNILPNTNANCKSGSLEIDNLGNVYVAYINSCNSNTFNYTIKKFDNDVNSSWTYNITGNCFSSNTLSGFDLAIDNTNNKLYVAGAFTGTVDFNYPSGGAYLVSSTVNGFIMRLSTLGSFEWVKHLECNNNLNITSILTNNGLETYSLGSFIGTCDLNPTSSIDTMSSNNTNLYIAKYGLCSPNPPVISINGNLNLCQGNSVVLTSNSLSNNLWSNNQNTQSITVNSSGIYSVTVTDINGCINTSQPVTVTVNPNPPTPTINQAGNLLVSSSSVNNQWFLNGNPIPNANGQIYTVTQNGIYTVQVVNSFGCSSVSLPVSITTLEILQEENGDKKITIYPNPTSGDIFCKKDIYGIAKICIFNSLGQLMYCNIFDENIQEIQISLKEKGLFQVVIQIDSKYYNYKIINK